jgi:ribosomal protein S20
MANTSSAKKAIRSSAKKNVINSTMSVKYKDAVRDFNSAVTAGESKKKLGEKLSVAFKQIDKAARKKHNVLSENKAGRLKSKLSKLVK